MMYLRADELDWIVEVECGAWTSCPPADEVRSHLFDGIARGHDRFAITSKTGGDPENIYFCQRLGSEVETAR